MRGQTVLAGAFLLALNWGSLAQSGGAATGVPQMPPPAGPSAVSAAASTGGQPLHSPAAVDLQTMGRFEAARRRAMLLYEMDTAAWAGTDTLQPALGPLIERLPFDSTGVKYVAWKEGDTWCVLFYYTILSGKRYPMGEVRLGPPLTRTSRAESHLFDLAQKEPLSGPAERLAGVKEKGSELFERALKKPFRPPWNGYEVAEEDGSGWFYAIMGDTSYSTATAGPTFAVHMDAQGGVLEQRQTITTSQAFPLKLRSGQDRWPERPVLSLASPYPEAEDLLFLLLHPALSPLVSVAGSGTFVLRTGEPPEYRGQESPESVVASLGKLPMLPTGSAAPVRQGGTIDRKDPRKKEIDESTRVQGAALYFNAFLQKEARQAVAGSIRCGDLAETLDAVLEPDGSGGWVVFLAAPGSGTPCLAVRPSGPTGPQNAWSFSVLPSPPAVSPRFLPTLALVRAAREEVGEFLGPGAHYYVPFLDSEGAMGQVYAWSSLEREPEAGRSEDAELVGSCVVMVFARTGETFRSVGDVVVDLCTRGWNVTGVPDDLPFGIRSAADPDRGFFGPFDVLRCRLNSWLCPRLMKSGEEWVVVQGDGKYEVLSQRQAKKLKDLPKALYPAKVYENPKLTEFEKKAPTVLRDGEKANP